MPAAKRMHHNVVAAVLANKLTRIAWSALYHGPRGYEPRIRAERAQASNILLSMFLISEVT